MLEATKSEARGTPNTHFPYSNRLIEVTDAVIDINYKDLGFKDGYVGLEDDFEYDVNGNMTKDRNKAINSISYNHLNLPVSIVFDTLPRQIYYVYDATGVKLKKSVTDEGTVTTEYAGNYTYNNAETGTMILQFMGQAEGYIIPVANTGGSVKGSLGGITTYSSYSYVFQYKDHLGNVRLSYSDSNLDGSINASSDEIIEESNYYPFGLKQKGYNNTTTGNGNALAQRWKFGGKEYNEELDLNWYDVTARNYDPALGRWMNLDPLAEAMRRHSPYNFSFDNPVFYLDPDGMMPLGFNGGDIVKNTFDNGPQNLTSTVVNDQGEIIDHRDDGDPNIYLNSRQGRVIGTEQFGKNYIVGEHLTYNDLDRGVQLPQNFMLQLFDNIDTFDEVTLWEVPWYMGGPRGAWKSIRILGYFARLKILFNGGTAKVTVQILANVDKSSNLIKLLRLAESEAKAAGASRLVIEGVEILNKSLISPKAQVVFKRLGYTIEQVTDTTIKLVKNLN